MTFIFYYLVWQVFFGLVFLGYMKTLPQWQHMPVRQFSTHDSMFWLVLTLLWPISICLILFDLYDHQSFLRDKIRKWRFFSK